MRCLRRATARPQHPTAARSCSMPVMKCSLVTIATTAPRRVAGGPGRRLGQAHRDRRARPTTGRRACPAKPCLRGQPHDRLPGQGRHEPRHPTSSRADGRDRRLDDRARQARQEADQLLRRRTSAAPRSARHHGPASPRRRSLRAAWSPRASCSSSQPYFGTTVQFPLDEVDRGQEGRGRRPHRADLGAGAGASACGNDTSWRASRGQGQVRRTTSDPADRAARVEPAGAVLLPVPHRAPDLQRDADLDPMSRLRRVEVAVAPLDGAEPSH